MTLSFATLCPCFLYIVQTTLEKNAGLDGGGMKSILYFCGLN